MLVKHFELRLIIFVLLVSLSSAVLAHKDGGIVVKDAWVREAPPVSPVLAAYMTIENHTGEVKSLTSVTSSAFRKIEIHQTIYKDGMASMEGQDKLTISAEGKIELTPGGTHLMLINPVKKLKAGDTVSFVLNFDNGSKSIVSATVKKARSMSSSDHPHDKVNNHGKEHKHNH